MRKNFVLLCCIVLLTGCSANQACNMDSTVPEGLPADYSVEESTEDNRLEELESKVAELESIIEELTATEEDTTEEESANQDITIYFIEDGLWHSGQSMTKESYAYFTDAYIENGVLYIEGLVGKYDADWNEELIGANHLQLKLADDCGIFASGGVAEDTKVDETYFNNCFHNSFTGLGLTIISKNGLIIKILVCS